MMKIDKTRIVKAGEWFYNGTAPCQVIITREDFLPGSGNHEDSPEIADDRAIPCVQIWYESPSKRGDFNAGGGYAMNIEEAIARVEKTITGKVVWKGP